MPSILRKHSISTDLAPEGVSSRSQVKDSRISRRHIFLPKGVLRGGHYCLKQTEAFEWFQRTLVRSISLCSLCHVRE